MPVVHSSGRICYDRSEMLEILEMVSQHPDRFCLVMNLRRKVRKSTRSISSTQGLEDVLEGDLLKSINLRSENEDAEFDPEASSATAGGGGGGWKRVSTSSGRGRSNPRQRNPSFTENERPGGAFVKRTQNFQRFHTNSCNSGGGGSGGGSGVVGVGGSNNGDGKSQPFWRQRTKSGGNLRNSTSEDQPAAAPPPGFKESPHVVEQSSQEVYQEEATDEMGVNFWFYIDPENRIQGPFHSDQMNQWNTAGYLPLDLQIRRKCDASYYRLSDYHAAFNGSPFVLCPPGMAPKMTAMHLKVEPKLVMVEEATAVAAAVAAASVDIRPGKAQKVKMSSHSDIKFIIDDSVSRSSEEAEQIVPPRFERCTPKVLPPPSSGGGSSSEPVAGWAAIVSGHTADDVFHEVVAAAAAPTPPKEKKGKKSAAAPVVKKTEEVVAAAAVAVAVVEEKKKRQKLEASLAKLELPAGVNWAQSSNSSQVVSQSLVEIQAAQAAEEAKKQKLAAIKLKQQLQQQKSQSGWAAVASAGVPTITTTNSNTTTTASTVAVDLPEKAPAITVKKKKKNGLPRVAIDHALRDWCMKQLDNLPPINSAVDKPTLIGLLCEMQDQREVLECIETSLGKSKKVTKFSREFLQRRQLTGQS